MILDERDRKWVEALRKSIGEGAPMRAKPRGFFRVLATIILFPFLLFGAVVAAVLLAVLWSAAFYIAFFRMLAEMACRRSSGPAKHEVQLEVTPYQRFTGKLDEYDYEPTGVQKQGRRDLN